MSRQRFRPSFSIAEVLSYINRLAFWNHHCHAEVVINVQLVSPTGGSLCSPIPYGLDGNLTDNSSRCRDVQIRLPIDFERKVFRPLPDTRSSLWGSVCHPHTMPNSSEQVNRPEADNSWRNQADGFYE